jgi:WD40 repeat protein
MNSYFLIKITGDDHGSVKLWNLINGQISETMLQKIPKPTRCVRLSQSYRFSVSAYTDCSVKIYDNEICEIFSEFNEHKAPVNHIYILEESKKILSADANDQIKVWLAKNGQLVDSIVVPCKMLCCSPDGNCIVSGSGDNM